MWSAARRTRPAAHDREVRDSGLPPNRPSSSSVGLTLEDDERGRRPEEQTKLARLLLGLYTILLLPILYGI